MSTGLSAERLETYRRGARERLAQERSEAERRRARAWVVARQAAERLKSDFGATKVIAFGSLAHGHWFRPQSDIDLAAEGIPASAFWRAWAALDKLEREFEIQLFALETASPILRQEIHRYGAVL